MELWQRITQARAAAGLSQQELADKLSVPVQTVTDWENGADKPDLDAVISLSRALNVSTDSLLLGAENAVPQPGPGTAADDGPGKDLSGRRYAIVLTEPVETVYSRALELVTDEGKHSYTEARAMLESAPTILLRDLDAKTAREDSLALKASGCIVRVIEDEFATTISVAMAAPAVDLLGESDAPKPPKEPMSFGETVLAVAIGVIAGLIVLSLF